MSSRMRLFLLLSLVMLPCFQAGAAQWPLLAERENASRPFDEIRIAGKIVYYHQRMIEGARVEGDHILYQFDANTEAPLADYRVWRNDLPTQLPDLVMDAQIAELMVDGEIVYTELIYISPDSDIFKFDPMPVNPCWVVAHQGPAHQKLSVFDAVTGDYLGQGIAPPSESYSLTGPTDTDACTGSWDAWSGNAKYWFERMGYTCTETIWPSTQEVGNQIQSIDVALFYELAHGGSSSFEHNCSSTMHSSMIANWLVDYEKMPFTFLGSCDGMCNTGPGSFSYAFRKTSFKESATIGYCGMSTENCGACWGYSLYWQSTLFEELEAGATVQQAYDAANARWPACTESTNCMRLAGDPALQLIPKLARGIPDPNWMGFQSIPLNNPDAGRAVAWSDIDQDGYPDLYLSNDNTDNILMLNQQDYTFQDYTWMDAADTGPGRGAIFGDWNNDGREDLFIVNEGAANRLLDCIDGFFYESTANFPGDVAASRAAAWADYDADGDLDLFVANYNAANILYRNDGDGFTPSGVGDIADTGPATACTWADYDSDGDPDLYVVNENAANLLLRNDDGVFSNIATGAAADPGAGRAAAWADYDNDGDPDLHLVNFGDPCRLLRNTDGVLSDVTTGDLVFSGAFHSSAWSDYDNDGDLDLCVCASDGDLNRMLENDGGVFTNIASGPMTEADQNLNLAWGDFDDDGRQDLYMLRAAGSYNQILRNVNKSLNTWLKLDLDGVESNRSAIGARIDVIAGDLRLTRVIDGGTGACSQNERTVCLGLGAHAGVDTLRISWPSGLIQTMTGIPGGQRLWILEQEQPEWTPVTSAALNDAGDGCGGAWVDSDGDGDLDLHISNNGSAGRLLQNTGGSFNDIAVGDLATVGASRCPVWADFDNDGDQDCYLSRFGEPNLLLSNDGGVFNDIAAYGTENDGDGGGVSFLDCNADGLLDLYLVNFNAANALFHGYGDPGLGQWVFLPTPQAGDDGPGKQAAFADYDLDGDLDLLVVNYLGSNVLYNYDPDQGFIDVTPSTLSLSSRCTAASWGDYDNDGDPDLYLANTNGIFSTVSGGDLGDTGNARGVAWLDYDNDADLDLFVSRYGQGNLMLKNTGGEFQEVPLLIPAVSDQSNGALFADYDRDGDLDAYVINTGANMMLENRAAAGNHWLHIDLIGLVSNRDAIGSRLRVVTGDISQTRTLTASSGGGAQDSPTVEFGLGAATVVDSLIVDWPLGARHVFTELDADQVLSLDENGEFSAVGRDAPRRISSGVLDNSPNPFNPRTTIRYILVQPDVVTLCVYDMQGRRVRMLESGAARNAGEYRVLWNGKDDLGRQAPSGLYLCRLVGGTGVLSRTMTLLK